MFLQERQKEKKSIVKQQSADLKVLGQLGHEAHQHQITAHNKQCKRAMQDLLGNIDVGAAQSVAKRRDDDEQIGNDQSGCIHGGEGGTRGREEHRLGRGVHPNNEKRPNPQQSELDPPSRPPVGCSKSPFQIDQNQSHYSVPGKLDGSIPRLY
jgi:hypothetical protein